MPTSRKVSLYGRIQSYAVFNGIPDAPYADLQHDHVSVILQPIAENHPPIRTVTITNPEVVRAARTQDLFGQIVVLPDTSRDPGNYGAYLIPASSLPKAEFRLFKRDFSE